MKVKYFLRGLGIGILVTALLLFAGSKKANTNTLTDAEIMERASELGMLTEEEVRDYRMDESLDNLKESLTTTEEPVVAEVTETPQESESPSPSPSPSSSPSPEESEEAEKSPSPSATAKKKQKTISIEIKSGMGSKSVAKYLYQKDVIENASNFIDYMKARDVTHKLRAGKYEIPIDASYAEIVEIIT